MLEKFLRLIVMVGVLLITIGLFANFNSPDELKSYLGSSAMNLNMKQIDIIYSNDDSMEKEEPVAIETPTPETPAPTSSTNTSTTPMSYTTDPSWGWPAASGYYLSTYYSGYHPAIDIVPTNGDYNIYAASSGVVVTNSYKWDGGNYLVIKQDNGYYSLYCHLSEKWVQEGERVNKGQVIGIMGRTGLATGVHLHYSIWNGYPYHHSSSINPLNFY